MLGFSSFSISILIYFQIIELDVQIYYTLCYKENSIQSKTIILI